MLRVVLDANVLISAILTPHGEAAKIIRAWKKDLFRLLVSDAILSELGRVLLYPKIRKRHGWDPAEVRHFLDNLARVSMWVPATVHLHVVHTDPSDDRYLECAVSGDADLIVSGDQDLLDIRMYQNIAIVTFRNFLKALESQTQE